MAELICHVPNLLDYFIECVVDLLKAFPCRVFRNSPPWRRALHEAPTSVRNSTNAWLPSRLTWPLLLMQMHTVGIEPTISSPRDWRIAHVCYRVTTTNLG